MVDGKGYALPPNGGREILFRRTRMQVKVGHAEGATYSLSGPLLGASSGCWTRTSDPAVMGIASGERTACYKMPSQ